MRIMDEDEITIYSNNFSNISGDSISKRSTSTTTICETVISQADGKEIRKRTTIISRISSTRLEVPERIMDSRVTLEPQSR